jgi:anti-anti-sigma factor
MSRLKKRPRSPVKPETLRGGYYDIARKDELEAELGRVEPHSDVVLNLDNVEHLDCSCLGVMVARLQSWRKAQPGTNLRLQNVSRHFAKILCLVELDQLFIIDSIRA